MLVSAVEAPWEVDNSVPLLSNHWMATHVAGWLVVAARTSPTAV